MESKFSALLKYSCILLFSIVFFDSNAAVYYSQKSLGGSANAALLSAWNSSISGGGSTPANFSSGDEFHIVNGDIMIPGSLWTISGGGKLVIENGKFTANGFDHALTVDIQNTGEYIVKSAYNNLTLGSLTSASTFTVQYVQGGITTHFRNLNYGGNLNLTITSTSGTTVNLTGSFSSGGNLTLNAAVASQVFSMNSSAAVNVTGNFTLNNGIFYTTTGSFNPIYTIGGNLVVANGTWATTKTTGAPTYNISGSLILNGGTFYGIINTSTANAVYNINGSMLLNGGIYVAKNSTSTGNLLINLNGSGTLSATGATITSDNHVITVNGTYSLSSNFSSSNTLTIASGKVLSLGSSTLSLKGGYVGNGTLTGGSTSNLSVSGTVSQNISLKSITLNTFTINNANAIVTLAGAMTVSNNLILIAGQINNSSNALILSDGCTIIRNAATITVTPTFSGIINVLYNGSALSTGFELPYNNTSVVNNVTFSNSTAIDLYDNLTINGTLTINSGATFQNKSKELTIKGNIVNNGTFLNPYSTITFNGTTTLSGSSDYNFNIMNINSGASLTATPETISVISSFNLATGGSFDANAGTVNFARTSGSQTIPGKVKFFDLVLSSGATKVFSPTDTVFIANTFSSSGGSITTSNSAINFNGTGAQSIPALNYVTLALSGSGTKTPTAALTVSKNLIISGSAVLDGSNTTITTSGNWTSAESTSYTGTNGTVVFNNTAAATINGNGVQFNNITFSGTGSKTFTSAATVVGILTPTAGTVNTGGFLTVNLTTGAISGTGSGTISGNVTFIKYVQTAASNFLAFPVAGATGADLADDFEFLNPTTNKTRLSVWDCATQKYLSNQPSSTAFTQGVGFQFFAATPGNVDVTGAYNHVNSGYTVTSCTSTANKFVLAGNPYPSTLDWNSAGWTKTNLNDAIYFFNPATSTFASYINGTPSNGGSQYIPSLQGFYITTNGSGIGSLTSTNAVRTTLTNPGLYRISSASAFALEVSYKHYTDEAVIVLNEDASFDFEGDKDALKLINPDAAPSLYTTSFGIDYSINSIPSLSSGYVLPLGLKVTETGSYTFAPKNISNVDGVVYLEDKLTGQLIDLKSNPSHTVTVDSTQTDRFQLRFASSGNASTSAAATKIYYYDGMIHVSFVDAKSSGTMSLYSVLGTPVMDNVSITGAGEIATNAIKPGAYIVKVVENGTISTQKIIIQ